MAMIIAWQTVNAVRHPNSKKFTRGFLVLTPGITIRDRLRVLEPNDPASYYESREPVELDLDHLEDFRRSSVIVHLTKRLIESKWRDPLGQTAVEPLAQLAEQRTFHLKVAEIDG